MDSAVAAARLLQQGYDVHAFFMQLEDFPGGDSSPLRDSSPLEDSPAQGAQEDCLDPTAKALDDARKVAKYLGIPSEKFHVWQLADRFASGVITPFVAAYAHGLTPNPCVRCNRVFKFGYVVRQALREGFDYVATGHYARVDHAEDPGWDSYSPGSLGATSAPKASELAFDSIPAGSELKKAGRGGDFPRFRLRRGAAAAKDQSYVLAGARATMLSHALFPLWNVTSKADTRAEAQRLGLPVAHKRDSFDICFIHDGDTRGFLRTHLGGIRPGAIVDENGIVVGQHLGAFLYTVGQRRGLHLPRPHSDGQPRYVTAVDVSSNTVTVGPLEALQVQQISCGQINWLVPPVFGRSLLEGGVDRGETSQLTVQFRAHSHPEPARFEITGSGEMLVNFPATAVIRGIASGQSLVVYWHDWVIAQAEIKATR